MASSNRFMFDSVAISDFFIRALSGCSRFSRSTRASAGAQSRFWKNASNNSSLTSESSGLTMLIAHS